MVDSVLSAAFSANIQNTREIQRESAQASERLASGSRLNSPLDDPSDFYSARALANRISELSQSTDSLQQEQSLYGVAEAGLSALTQFSQQLYSIAQSAQFAETTAQRESLADQFNDIRAQINGVINDSSFRASGALDDLNLSIGNASADFNDFATQADIDSAIASVSSGLTQVRGVQREFANDLAISQIREDYNDGLSAVAQEGRDSLRNADLNEEAVRQLAAQVRTDLSFQSQQLLAEGESLLLGLFG